MFEFLSQLIQLIETFVALSPEALAKALIVLVSVFLLRALTVVPNSKWARFANIALSALLSGITSSATSDEMAVFTMTIAFSAGLWEAIVYLYTNILKKEKPFNKKK